MSGFSWKRWPAGAWLGRPSAKDRVVAFRRTSRPLTDWLETHVGPPLATAAEH